MNELKLHESAQLDERYYSCSHKSGLSVYVFPKKMSTTYVLMGTAFGSFHNLKNARGENVFPAGTAHFLEHKLFANEDGSDSFERFSAFGADANAYTAYNRTVYLFSTTKDLARPLAELLDFVTHPHFTPQSVAKEQGIIAEEIRMCHDDPYDRVYQNLLLVLYHKHPVRAEICGSERSISEITAPLLYEAYRAFYRLSNMFLIVCGDVTPEEVMEIADAHLPLECAPPPLPRSYVAEPAEICKPRVESFGQVAKPIFHIGIKDVSLPGDHSMLFRRDLKMELLCEMLFSDTGELYEDLYERNLVSPGFGASYSSSEDYGCLQFSGEADDPDKVLAEILAYIERVRATGLSSEEFERARRIMLASYIKAFDSTEEIAESMVTFLMEGADIFSYPDVINSITFEELAELFSEFFDPSRVAISIVRPQGEEEVSS